MSGTVGLIREQSDAPAALNGAADDGVLEQLRRHPGPVIVDLDETLYLRNSTQDFLRSARPRHFAVAVLRLLQLIKPWRLTGAETADVWRVCAITALMPWTWWLWRRHVRRMATSLRNERLARVLRERQGEFIIATLGFRPIVRPLLKAMALGDLRLTACRVISFSDRNRGKLAILVREHGEDYVRGAAVLTDSETDSRLLKACALPLLHQWQGARYESAMKGLYFPFDYISQVKRPGKSYVRRLLVEDLAIWILAAAPASVASVASFVSLLCLFVSFWSVYEIGYIDNDVCALKRELDGKPAADFQVERAFFAEARLWLFAIAFGAAAIFASGGAMAMKALDWGLLLLAVRAVYAFYNRIDKRSRILIYPALQVFRAAAFAVLLPISAVGVALCGAFAGAQWVSYLIYRLPGPGPGSAWPILPKHLIRLVLFLMLAAALAFSPARPISLPVLAAATLWQGFLSRHELGAVFRQAHWLKLSSR